MQSKIRNESYDKWEHSFYLANVVFTSPPSLFVLLLFGLNIATYY